MVGKVSNNGTLVMKNNSRNDIRAHLFQRNVLPRLGVGIYRLNRMKAGQYGLFLQLIDKLNIKTTSPLRLYLPPLKLLVDLDFKKLMDTDTAMNQIKSRCVKPDGNLILDFTLLPWIQKTFIDNPSQENISTSD